MYCKQCCYFEELALKNMGNCLKLGGIVFDSWDHSCNGFKNKFLKYGDIYNKFYNNNPNLENRITDCRPYDCNSIILWFDNGVSLVVKYNIESDDFELIKMEN